MRLLYLHQYFKKPSMNGGVRSYEFAKRLAKSGVEVIIITSDTENKFRGWKVEKLDGFEVHWVSIKYNNSFGFIARLWAFFKFLVLSSLRVCRLQSDKLLATSTPLTVAIPALIYKFVKRKPYIFEVRDVWPEVPIAMGVIKNSCLIKLASYLEVLAYRYSEHVIALSPDMKRSILCRSPLTNVTVIPNAADLELFNLPLVEDDDLVRKLRNIKNRHKKVVFYTGTFGRVNNLRSLIKLSSYSDGTIGFVLVGEGGEECELKSYAESLGVFNQALWFIPSVSKTQLSAIHTLFDIATSTVLPIEELYANSANKVFDAFASGTPVLINHGGWLEHLIKNEHCGIVISNDPGLEDYKSLEKFLFSSKNYEYACEASRRMGLNYYNRENLFQKLFYIIKGNS